MSALAMTIAAASCDESAPHGLRRTPAGPGATIRFDLAHTPLPEIPLPNDTATWPDPTSRTGLRINASLVAPTEIEKNARQQFDQLEGWGTFAPISVSFDLAEVHGHPRLPTEAALDLDNVAKRHQGDDYDFANDAFYLVNLDTGVPVALDVGNGNFDYTLKKLDKYWPNDTRASERNLLFDTIDETKRGSIGRDTFTAALDTDFDGTLDVPNLDDPFACPDPSPVCDDAKNPQYASDTCVGVRRLRDRCVADHFLPFYERETDTLLLRPIIPMSEMTRYAVVVTDRLVDANGDAVKSPFEFIYHASQEASAARVMEILNKKELANYYGDIAGTGLDHVAFTWSFTTEPTVDDMKLLRDGLYGRGPFAKFATDYPVEMTMERAVGLIAGLANGATETPGWQTSEMGKSAGCDQKADNLFIIHADDLKPILKQLITEGFGEDDGPATQELVRTFEAVDYLMIGTYKTPFLLEGGPKSTDPKAAFRLNYKTGEGEITTDTVQFFAIVPKETAQFHQPFDVNVYGHGYTGAFIEEIIYAGNLAKHGLATIGINAMGHGLDFGDPATDLIVKGVLSSVCVAPFNDALLQGRARDLNRDGRVDSGGDFWSSYLFHTRDGVRQSILDHIQLVRIMRAFGSTEGKAKCQNEQTGWDKPATADCDANGDGKADVFGDFDGNGVPDFGGPNAHYSTWGESLGGILSGIHGAIDAYVTAASPGSGGGGLTDIGIRSFQGGVVEAVLLRIWGPLIVTVPADQRPVCTPTARDHDFCTMCSADQISLRWVMPDLNDTGELEIRCVDKSDIQGTTVYVTNQSNQEVRCARVDDKFTMRVGIPASIGDRIDLRFYDKVDQVRDYGSCAPIFDTSAKPRTEIASYGPGRIPQGTPNDVGTATCDATSCSSFQGQYYGEGKPLVAPAEGFGQIRQTPSLRRFIQLAQAALDPGDPISFAPYYAIRQMTDPFGQPIAPHAVLTLNTIGDMNVPLNSGIAFARATGAVPFMRPEQAALYPEYAPYVTPQALYTELGGKTPNQVLVSNQVIEGVTKLARHPAGASCAGSANADLDGTWTDSTGAEKKCFPTGCTADTEKDPATRVCYPHSRCNDKGECKPDTLGAETCEEALFDADDLDEGEQLYFEQASPIPLRLVRYTEQATVDNLAHVWEPRIAGAPRSADGGWTPSQPVTGLLDAYIVPGGVHTFTNGNPCENFDSGTYLTNLVARFFMTNGEDVYYLSHPTTHHCLASDPAGCGYLE
ncbi:MAG: hypothetical protein U0414_37545 [Polyangiaceae bacterium]